MKEENILLGQILKNNDIFHSLKIKADSFTDSKNKLIFNTISYLIKKGEKANLNTVYSEINEYAEYISGLTSNTDANWKFYENKILEANRKRRFLTLAKQIQEDIKKDSTELYTFIQSEINDIVNDYADDFNVLKIGDMLHDFINLLETRKLTRGQLPGLDTGFKCINQVLLGFEKEKYYVIGARASVGKSALLFNFAANIARTHKVGILSLESGRNEIMTRLISSVGGVNTRALRTGYYRDSDMGKIQGACGQLYEKDIYIYDKPNITIDELEIQTARMVKEFKIDILLVDYLQLVKSSGDSRIEKVANVSLTLKELARRYKIPVVTAAQLRRDAENRRPGLNDLSDSSQIEKDADCVILIYEKNDEHILIVAKNRDGAKSDISIKFNKEYVRFEEK